MMDNYSYDHRTRTASPARAILKRLIEAVLDDRDRLIKSLLQAYIDAIYDYDIDSDTIERASEVERIMYKVYNKTFARYFRSEGDPIEDSSFDIPDAFYRDDVPRDAAVAVAEAMGRQDARDAEAMRQMALRQR